MNEDTLRNLKYLRSWLLNQVPLTNTDVGAKKLERYAQSVEEALNHYKEQHTKCASQL